LSLPYASVVDPNVDLSKSVRGGIPKRLQLRVIPDIARPPVNALGIVFGAEFGHRSMDSFLRPTAHSYRAATQQKGISQPEANAARATSDNHLHTRPHSIMVLH
jgi:hypothetical protein